MKPALSPPSRPLLSATVRLLRPLVRLLIRGGVTCPTFMDLVRGVYVEEARAMLPDPRAQTDSRISLMTGVHRKELRRLREAVAAPPESLTVGSQVAAQWLGGAGLQDTAGAPAPLARPAFEALVEGVTRDVRPRAVLDDWLEQGLIAIDAEGRVVLQAAAFLPKPGRDEQVHYLGRNVGDHLAAAAANVVAEGPAPFLDRSVHYDGLSAAAAAALADVARKAAQRMLLDVNRAALSIAAADDAARTTELRRHRVNLGAYLFDAEENPG